MKEDAMHIDRLPSMPEWVRLERPPLRHVDFTPTTSVMPGLVTRQADFQNPDAEYWSPQTFHLTASAPERYEQMLIDYTEALRVWFEAVPDDPDLAKRIAELEGSAETERAFEPAETGRGALESAKEWLGRRRKFILLQTEMTSSAHSTVYAAKWTTIPQGANDVWVGGKLVKMAVSYGTADLRGLGPNNNVNSGPVSAGGQTGWYRGNDRCVVHGVTKATYDLDPVIWHQ
jgi:hypothetical protein